MSSDPPAAPAITPVDLDAIKARVKLAQRMFGVAFDGYPDTDRAPVDIQRDRDRSALLREVERLRAEMAFSRAVKEPEKAEAAAASHLLVLRACAAGECSDPNNCEERYPSTLCARCRASIYVQSLASLDCPWAVQKASDC